MYYLNEVNICISVKLGCFVQAIYVPADDLTDPSPATTFSHLDATTVLSRQVAELGFYPAVDPLESSSRIMDPNIVGLEHYDCARRVKKILQVMYKLLDVHCLISALLLQMLLQLQALQIFAIPVRKKSVDLDVVAAFLHFFV